MRTYPNFYAHRKVSFPIELYRTIPQQTVYHSEKIPQNQRKTPFYIYSIP
jgi:hypothetical protein